MSCSPFDLRDYFFKDLAENERRQTEAHVKTCAHCREELERLHGTESALLALPDEEIPQRIGFVSDPVFQPSGFRRGWDALWGSAARLGFVTLMGLIPTLRSELPYWNWYGFPGVYTAAQFAVHLVGFLVGGLVLAWFIRPVPE